MGTVLIAENHNQEKFALKYMSDEKMYVNEFNNQQLLASKGKSPMIAHASYDTKRDVFVIVMELMPKSLEDLRQEYRVEMDIQTKLNIMIQSFDILKDLHASGVLHLDIKFSNFVIDK